MNNILKTVGTCMLFAATSPSFAEPNGKDLFNTYCGTCHGASVMPRVAPPYFGVVDHVKSVHQEKDRFVEYTVDWVANPEEGKSLMSGAIRRFGLMPAFPYEETQVRLIAEYLYGGNEELPAWYIEHYEAEHGHKPQEAE